MAQKGSKRPPEPVAVQAVVLLSFQTTPCHQIASSPSSPARGRGVWPDWGGVHTPPGRGTHGMIIKASG